MISEKFVIIGALVELWGCAVYAKDTLAGKTKPNRITWFMWALAPGIAFAAELNKGVSFFIALMTLSIVIAPLIVLVSSFVNPNAYWRLHSSDYVCGALSLLGVVLWLIYREADVAILFAILADGLAAAPTLVKSFKHPQTESLEAYTAGFINGGIALLAVKHWTIANYGFPLYIFLMQIIFIWFIKFKVGLKVHSRKTA